MICRNCGNWYDETFFKECPYCGFLTEKQDTLPEKLPPNKQDADETTAAEHKDKSTFSCGPGDDGRNLKYCRYCGKEINPQALFCEYCGAPLKDMPDSHPVTPGQPYAATDSGSTKSEAEQTIKAAIVEQPEQTPKKMNGFGLAGFVLSLVSCVISLYCIISIVALVFSAIGMARRSHYNQANNLTLAGLIISIVALVLNFFILLLI